MSRRVRRTGPAGQWLDEHCDDLGRGLADLRGLAPWIDERAEHLATVLRGGGRLLAAGNGGSAAEAQHLTAELVGRFRDERVPLSAIALHAESSSLTAIVNDYGIEEMFARQVAAHGRPGDVLVVLSTSGESANVVSAARRARELGLAVWALTGPGPSTLGAASDEVLACPGASTAAVQEMHLVAVHALCAALDEHLAAPARARAVPRSVPRSVPVPVPVAMPVPVATPVPVPEPATRARQGAAVVAVVGDVLLDRDVDGQVTRFSPDGPVPVVDAVDVRQSPGGAGLTAILCAREAPTRLLAPVGTDDAAGDLARMLGEHVDLVALPQEGATRTKTRVRSSGRTLVRVDEGGPARPGTIDPGEVRAALDGAAVVLVSDYGAGVTYDGPLRTVLQDVVGTVPVVWDPHPRGGPPVAGATLVTPNLAEALAAATALGLSVDPDDVGGLCRALCRAWDVEHVCVTVGERGAFLAGRAGDPWYVAARAVTGDACGAGDRFAATAAVALARREPVADAVLRAVGAASGWVEAGGADGFRRRDVPPRPVPLAGSANGSADGSAGGSAGGSSGSPARTGPGEPAVARLAARLRQEGTIVATGGCFDVLHAGHVAMLEAASRLGDRLVVLVNSDESVRRLKGPRRPAVPQEDRARLLGALDCVAQVVVFDDDDPSAVLEELRPDVWAKGGDYVADELTEADAVRRHGGRVVILPYLEGRSTTAILERSSPLAPPADPPSPATVLTTTHPTKETTP